LRTHEKKNMTSRPDLSASSMRALFVAGAALSLYLFAAFAGCSDSGGTERPPGDASGAGGSNQATGPGTGPGTTVTGAGGGVTTGGGNTTGGTPGTTGPGGTTTTGGAGSRGTGGTTGAGGTGAGGAGGTGGGNVSGCIAAELPAGNRCTFAGQPVVAKGGQNLIDDLEPAAGDTATCHKIKEVDGRTGSWNSGKDDKSPMGSVVHSFEPPGSGGAPGSTRAVHVVGQGLNGYGGYLAVPLAPCYNASAYQGLSFWMKGDPTKAPWMKLSIMTPQSVEAAQGGSCIQPPVGHPPTQLECYDNFSVHLFKVSNIWTRYAITWQQLAQFGWGQPITGVKGESQIIGLNFSPVWDLDTAPNKAFDLWFDDLSFDVNGPFTDTGFKAIVSQATFDAQFPSPNAVYGDPYMQMAAALDDPRFSRIGREGSADERKREIAAMMAHITQETGNGGVAGTGLMNVREISPPSNYCMAGTPYPCAPNQSYYGRGPLQLSWNYNYGQADDYFGLGTKLVDTPDVVATDTSLTWRGSMFFWMAWKDPTKNQLLVGPHYRFLHDGFGGTIRAINGGLECSGSAAGENRKALYQRFCGVLGVSGCDQNLACPPM
jgi:chitinase